MQLFNSYAKISQRPEEPTKRKRKYKSHPDENEEQRNQFEKVAFNLKKFHRLEENDLLKFIYTPSLSKNLTDLKKHF